MTAQHEHGDVCWHVSASVNRESISRHGLDWSRIGPTGGIAMGPRARGQACRPEASGVFLCGTLDDVAFFLGFGQHPLVDVWEVRVDGVELEDGPDGWLLCRTPVPPERLRLLDHDIRPTGRVTGDPLRAVTWVGVSPPVPPVAG